MKIISIIFMAMAASVVIPRPVAAGGKTDLVISYSGSNHGETDPCG